MKLFHDEEDGPSEPIPGLPEKLPEGERILWQGSPDALALAMGAFRLRWILLYFAGMTFWRVSAKASAGAPPEAMTSVVVTSAVTCIGAIALLMLIAYAMSRAALFTITNERVVLRYGVAVRKYINAPFAQMESAQLKRRSARVGDIALKLDGPGRTPFLHLWPFARPFQFADAQPMLRGLKDAESVAQTLARAARDRAPDKVRIEIDKPVSDHTTAAQPTAAEPA